MEAKVAIITRPGARSSKPLILRKISISEIWLPSLVEPKDSIIKTDGVVLLFQRAN